jgi:plasmid replication initiation protein
MANDLIVKDNRLVNAKYNLTKTQAKFIAFMASKIDKDDMDFFTYSMKLNDMLGMLDIERKHWKRLGRSLKELQTKLIAIQDDDEVMEYVSLISYFKITSNNDLVEYRFDKAMKSFLIQLKTNFTKLSLEKIMNFNSNYTIRMYEILEQKAAILKKYKNEKLVTFEVDLQELKEILVGEYNVKTDKVEIKKAYHLYSNFKQKVLDVAYEELKTKGESYFEYEPIKTGRSITSINFTIMTNKEKVKSDFREKKKQNLLNGKEKQIAQEQIRRIIERKTDIKDPRKFEQALFKKYLAGDLGYDKDLKLIKDELDRNELESMLKQYKGIQEQEEMDKKIEARQESIRKLKEKIANEKKDTKDEN